MSVCTALVVGFVAAINLAVPKLAASALQPTSSDLLWIVDAYVVVFACLVIPPVRSVTSSAARGRSSRGSAYSRPAPSCQPSRRTWRSC
ncbi:hypothetical protein NKH77_51090 [Streptomyces sp. M19]